MQFAEKARSEKVAYNAAWIISAPWAHPIWHTYVAFLYDLTTRTGYEPVILMKGATHEFMLHALDPDKPIPVIKIEPDSWGKGLYLLNPGNMGYQFKAQGDAQARDRIQGYMDRLEGETLSPDTDYRGAWDGLFGDGATLVKSIHQVVHGATMH